MTEQERALLIQAAQDVSDLWVDAQRRDARERRFALDALISVVKRGALSLQARLVADSDGSDGFLVQGE